jgi:DNA-binding response OmpR family regulator
VVDCAEIARDVFGTIAEDPVSLVRIHICHLRRALGRWNRLIRTVRARGYRLEP